jgi:tetratricopeptide (TPR) repeat protein
MFAPFRYPGILICILSTTVAAQDFSRFARCHQADQQLAMAADNQKRADREILLYDLYIDLKQIFDDETAAKSDVPVGLRRRCKDKKLEAYNKALRNTDATLINTYKVQWQAAEIREAEKQYKDALALYDRAAQLAPNDAEIQMKYFKIWDRHQRSGMDLRQKTLKTEELRNFLRDSEKRLNQIIAIKEAAPEIHNEALDILCNLHEELKEELKLKSCLESMFQTDPKNPRALRSLANYYLKRNLPEQAAPYLEGLQKIGQATPSDIQARAKVLAQANRYHELLELADTALKKNPTDKVYLNYKAKAESGLGNEKDLKKTLARLAKVDPESSILREYQAGVREKKGDEYLSGGLPSNALASYRSAMTLLSPDSSYLFKVQRKVALIIFDHYRSAAKDSAAMEVDMKEVVRLLKPILREKNPDPEILRIFVKATILAKDYGQSEEGCSKLFEEFAALNNRSEITLCADAYLKLGKRAKASLLYETSARKGQYSKEDIDAERKKRSL